MLVYGKNSCKEVLDSGIKIKKIFLSDNYNEKEIIDLIRKLEISPKTYSKRELDALADVNHQGIIMDIEDYKYCDLEEIIKENGFLVMLDHIEDTHNFGAIIRTCEAAGVDGIIIPKDRSVSVNSTVIKTSSGAVFGTKICMVTNLNQTIEELKKKGYWMVAADMDGKNYTKVDYKDNICLIIGNEGNGISNLVKKSSDFVVSIPILGEINSLNASVATGILIYEVVRQRNI